MRRIIAILAGMSLCAGLSAQTHYVDSDNKDMLRPFTVTGAERTEIVLPQVNGYNVYKADLHIHTFYSDGQVSPQFRVSEAWRDGLDVIAITDHIEYRVHDAYMAEYLDVKRHEDDKKVDFNVSMRIAQKDAPAYGITVIPGTEITRDAVTVGHYNVLFSTDNNLIYDDDPLVAIRNAKAQGALVMHNHPGWRHTDMVPSAFEQKVYAEGLIDGIEIMNTDEFYPQAIDRALQHGFFMSSNTDVHGATADEYLARGYYRNMTFILAEENTLEALREALEQRRTLAYSYGMIAGEEGLLKDFFNASVICRVLQADEDGTKRVALTNNTSLSYYLRFGDDNPILLAPFTTLRFTTDKDGNLEFVVENMWMSGNGHPQMKISTVAGKGRWIFVEFDKA